MNKQLLYAYPWVGSGWWGLLEKYIPAIQEIDPESTFDPKEKWGGLCLQVLISDVCKTPEEVWRLEQEAGNLSQTICEYCGKPGSPRTKQGWVKTLCDDCYELDTDEVQALYLKEVMMLGRKCESLISAEEKGALWVHWRSLSPLTDEFRKWYRALSYVEQCIVSGWSAKAEARMQSAL